MQRQRKLPAKRHSSYYPSQERTLEDCVSSNEDNTSCTVGAEPPKMRNNSVASGLDINRSRRKSLSTLHFDALQSAVSKLSRIDDFDLEELGYGFFSDVFKVTHKQTGKVMVLKRNRTTNTKLNILREVQLMNRLSHPNILKFMGVCVHEGQLHALTEFMNGGDIDQLVQKNVFLSWLVRVRLAYDVSKGLKYLHSMGIFHRDLTAKNCLVNVTTTNKLKKKYSAVLADLGLAEKIPTKEEDKEKLQIVGTPYCMAPEVIRQKPYDERSDFFSFGLMICQMIIRTSSDPDLLPRSNDFGLNRDLFDILVKRGDGAPEIISGDGPVSMPPASFLQLAYDCCKIDPAARPNTIDIVVRLEKCIEQVKTDRDKSKAQARAKEQEKLNAAKQVTSIEELMYAPLSRIGAEDINSRANGTDEKHGLDDCKHKLKSHINFRARLSRSSSDVSKELIGQAKSMIASSQLTEEGDTNHDGINDIVNSLHEAFINPFHNLEDESLQEQKLSDLPSHGVLELAFDLPTPIQPSARTPRPGGSPVRLRKSLHRKPDRPKSLLLDGDSADMNPIAHSQIGNDAAAESDIFVSSPVSPLRSSDASLVGDVLKKRHPSDTPEVRLKHAIIRSIVFSPQGTKLMLKCNRSPQKRNLKSISSLLSIISTKVGSLKKSISVPDLHRFSDSAVMTLPHHESMFGDCSRSSSTSSDHGSPRRRKIKFPSGAIDPASYPAYVTLPRKKKSLRRTSPTEAIRKRRARNSDDSMQDPTLLETLREETPEITNRITAETRMTPTTSGTPYQREMMQNDAIAQSSAALDPVFSSNCCERRDRENQSLDPRATQIGDESSASYSSDNSSNSLQMTLQTGVMSCTRRDKSNTHTESSKSLSESDKIACSKQPTRLSNRDSGYNDDAFTVYDCCGSLSPTCTTQFRSDP